MNNDLLKRCKAQLEACLVHMSDGETDCTDLHVLLQDVAEELRTGVEVSLVITPEGEVTFSNDFGPDIRFTGALIATSTLKNAYVSLYRTEGGKLISSRAGDRIQTRVHHTTDSVIDAFGHSSEAKALYRDAGFECVTVVD